MRALMIVFTGLVLNVLLSTALFWLAARWLKAAGVSLARALKVVLALGVVNVVLDIAFRSLDISWPAALVGIAVSLWIDCKIIGAICGLPMPKSLAAFFAGIVPASAVCFAILLLVVRPYWVEAYAIPTNSMAPTLVGEHRTADCPRCGGELIVPVPMDRGPTSIEAICSACLRSSTIEATDGPIKSRDRILVDKRLEPQRWDPAVYRVPDERGLSAVSLSHRIVGLPGEIVFIKDGGIWVNGARIELPDELHGLQYLDFTGEKIFGAAENPWRLGDNEYCLLGDFSAVSKDSRFYGPIARKDFIGIVVARYWPIPRWKVFR